MTEIGALSCRAVSAGSSAPALAQLSVAPFLAKGVAFAASSAVRMSLHDCSLQVEKRADSRKLESLALLPVGFGARNYCPQHPEGRPLHEQDHRNGMRPCLVEELHYQAQRFEELGLQRRSHECHPGRSPSCQLSMGGPSLRFAWAFHQPRLQESCHGLNDSEGAKATHCDKRAANHACHPNYSSLLCLARDPVRASHPAKPPCCWALDSPCG
mmetsp:Transcript_43952/g.77182  ORF Transcript_43952/g.77182 Transcript_43952/m.77182 type:complete len:213 (-) Transcript_43952:922-1560(-)